MNYTASAGSYVKYKGQTYYPYTFRLSGDSIVLTFNNYSALTITDDNYAVSCSLSANTRLPSVEVSGLNPISSDSEIGTSMPFYRIAGQIISCSRIDCPSVLQITKQGAGSLDGYSCFYRITTDKHIDLSMIIPVDTSKISYEESITLMINNIEFSLSKDKGFFLTMNPKLDGYYAISYGGTYNNGIFGVLMEESNKDINGESIDVFKSLRVIYSMSPDGFNSVSVNISAYLSNYSYNVLSGGL